MSHYKPYPAYKKTGLQWLETIPINWQIVQSRRLFSQRKDKAATGDLQLTASQKHGVVYQADYMAFEGARVVQVLKGADILKHVEPNDFVISMRSFQGGIEWSGLRGSISSAYVMLIPSGSVNAPYFKYLLKSVSYIQALQSTSDLIRDGQALRFDNFAQIDLPVIPFGEQQAISIFLDRETTRIDSLVTKKVCFIELLREKRQALITLAVTKGLDPNVKMKDSGVEWLGEVPEHWAVMAMKYIVDTPITDGPHETPDFVDEGIPFVSAEAISSGIINFEKIRGYITEDEHRRYSQKYHPERGDIFMIKSGATTGVTAIVDTDVDFNIWSPLAVIRCGTRSNSRFVLNFMRSRSFQDAIELNWSYGTQQNIGMGVIGDLAVTVPPLSEQEEIAHRIEIQTTHLETLISKTERSIELLKERRNALITAAVTGQIDLREAA